MFFLKVSLALVTRGESVELEKMPQNASWSKLKWTKMNTFFLFRDLKYTFHEALEVGPAKGPVIFLDHVASCDFGG